MLINVTKIVPVASGKGGVGKTVIVANLGLTLAARGKTVVLIDLDLGGSNLHTCLGLKNRYPGLGNYIYKTESSLEALLVRTEIDRLFFIPGDCLLPGTANLNFFTKQKIIREVDRLIADYILIDLGSGSAFNTLDFFLMSSNGIIITTAETTSILNTYSFLKTTLYRLLLRSFPRRSEERKIIQSFAADRIEGTDKSFLTLLDELGKINEESKRIARSRLEGFFPRIVLNMGKNEQDLAVGVKLRSIVRKNLGVQIEYIGYLRYDETVAQSILRRQPCFIINPNSDFSMCLDRLARKLIAYPDTPHHMLYEDNEDLVNLGAEVNAL